MLTWCVTTAKRSLLRSRQATYGTAPNARSRLQ